LKNAVAALLADLQRRLPSTPLALLTAGRAGTERLAMTVFLSRTDGSVLLPCESLGNVLASLTEQPREVVARVMAVDTAGQDLMRLIAKSSHVFVALWDGDHHRQDDDVARAVRLRLRGVAVEEADDLHVLDPAESGHVYHILTSRGDGSSSGRPGDHRLLEPESPIGTAAAEDEPELAFEPLEQIEVFNADVIVHGAALASVVAQSREWVLPRDDLARLDPATTRIVHTFAMADALALYNQQWSIRALRMLLVASVAAVLVSELYPLFFPSPWGATLYMLTLGAALGLLFLATRSHWHRKYLNYRAIAEALRVQLFWRLAGLPISVADSYLRVQRGELQGIRCALRFNELPLEYPSGGRPNAGALHGLRLAVEHWVAAQRRYFIGDPGDVGNRGRVGRVSSRIAFLERWREKTVWIGALLIAAVLALHAISGLLGQRDPAQIWRQDPQSVRDAVIMIGEVLLSVAAALATYEVVQGYTEQRRASRKLGELFSRAEVRLRQAIGRGEVEQGRKILEAIGREALAENADWLVMHRDRPIEFELG
jgi:hypothetical protein